MKVTFGEQIKLTRNKITKYNSSRNEYFLLREGMFGYFYGEAK